MHSLSVTDFGGRTKELQKLFYLQTLSRLSAYVKLQGLSAWVLLYTHE